MRPRHPWRTVACALVIALMMSATAHSRTLERTFGIGFEQTLTAQPTSLNNPQLPPDVSASGLLLQYWINSWSLEVILGGRAALVPSQPVAWAGFGSLGAHYNLLRAPKVNLSVGARAAVGLSRPVDADGNATKMRVGINVEVPLRVMYFLSENFAITGAVGLVVTIGSADINPLEGSKDTSALSLFRGGFSGGLGFVVLLD
ncbi:MAG: hypothetical protein CMH53_00210 [Myxococcales bacterium]|nr:hypothetical protein [Myxococcales bacterium]